MMQAVDENTLCDQFNDITLIQTKFSKVAVKKMCSS